MFLFPSFSIVFELSLKSKQTSALAYNDILSITDTIQTQTSGKSKPIHISYCTHLTYIYGSILPIRNKHFEHEYSNLNTNIPVYLKYITYSFVLDKPLYIKIIIVYVQS